MKPEGEETNSCKACIGCRVADGEISQSKKKYGIAHVHCGFGLVVTFLF